MQQRAFLVVAAAVAIFLAAPVASRKTLRSESRTLTQGEPAGGGGNGREKKGGGIFSCACVRGGGGTTSRTPPDAAAETPPDAAECADPTDDELSALAASPDLDDAKYDAMRKNPAQAVVDLQRSLCAAEVSTEEVNENEWKPARTVAVATTTTTTATAAAGGRGGGGGGGGGEGSAVMNANDPIGDIGGGDCKRPASKERKYITKEDIKADVCHTKSHPYVMLQRKRNDKNKIDRDKNGKPIEKWTLNNACVDERCVCGIDPSFDATDYGVYNSGKTCEFSYGIFRFAFDVYDETVLDESDVDPLPDKLIGEQSWKRENSPESWANQPAYLMKDNATLQKFNVDEMAYMCQFLGFHCMVVGQATHRVTKKPVHFVAEVGQWYPPGQAFLSLKVMDFMPAPNGWKDVACTTLIDSWSSITKVSIDEDEVNVKNERIKRIEMCKGAEVDIPDRLIPVTYKEVNITAPKWARVGDSFKDSLEWPVPGDDTKVIERSYTFTVPESATRKKNAYVFKDSVKVPTEVLRLTAKAAAAGVAAGGGGGGGGEGGRAPKHGGKDKRGNRWNVRLSKSPDEGRPFTLEDVRRRSILYYRKFSSYGLLFPARNCQTFGVWLMQDLIPSLKGEASGWKWKSLNWGAY